MSHPFEPMSGTYKRSLSPFGGGEEEMRGAMDHINPVTPDKEAAADNTYYEVRNFIITILRRQFCNGDCLLEYREENLRVLWRK